MTKILYIPNGEYINFYSMSGSGFPDDPSLEELVSDFPILSDLSISNILEFLNEDDADPEWYIENHVERNHIFSKEEIELIDD